LAKRSDDAGRAADFAELQAIAAGDADAFARLIDRESPRLLRLAQGMLGSLEEAEDVVQDTLFRLWREAGRWKPEARIGTWLHTVCYNRSIDRLRRRRSAVEESVLTTLPDEADLPDAALVQGEAAQSVRDAIARLPDRQRSALLLFHFQDLPQSEAARIMGVSETAFESLLARARHHLRRLLLAGGDEHD
jgi:RNA polymerase sigma-70 factor (ECF subfamily)